MIDLLYWFSLISHQKTCIQRNQPSSTASGPPSPESWGKALLRLPSLFVCVSNYVPVRVQIWHPFRHRCPYNQKSNAQYLAFAYQITIRSHRQTRIYFINVATDTVFKTQMRHTSKKKCAAKRMIFKLFRMRSSHNEGVCQRHSPGGAVQVR